MPKLIDLTGQKFGKLTVIERDTSRKPVSWICKCDCGEIVSRRSDSLRSGRTLSCGCLKDFKHRKIELIGQTFGELTIIGYGDQKISSSGVKIATYRCKCKCGNILDVVTGNLTNGTTQSCGCKRKQTFIRMFEDKSLIGKRFNKLLVLERINDQSKEGTKYKCLCDCGNIKNIRAGDLISGKTQSCGCIKYSIGEKNIANILTENNIKFKTEYKFKDLPDRRYDFAIFNDNNTIIRLIEFDGPQHYKETPYFHGTLTETQQRDKEKNEYAISNNIPLIRIPYSERDKITIELLFSNKYLINTAHLMEEHE